MKTALITGITGQDGSYLAEFLLEKGYEVHGIIRRSSSFNTGRIEHLYLEDAIEDMHKNRKIYLHYGDLTDSESLIRLIREIKPTEIYNLGATLYHMLWTYIICNQKNFFPPYRCILKRHFSSQKLNRLRLYQLNHRYMG